MHNQPTRHGRTRYLALVGGTRLLAAILLILFLTSPCFAHMELSSPFAIYSKSDPQTIEANKDYSMTTPLEKDGSNWPAKGRATKEIVDSITPVATLVAGEDSRGISQELRRTMGAAPFPSRPGTLRVYPFVPGSPCRSGSCQFGVSYDYMATQVVLASWIGGCPLKKPYTFKVPDIPGCSKCLVYFSWFNHSGAAVVSISGTASSFTGPQAFRMNTFGEGVCTLVEETDVVFPNPGEQVFYGEGFDASTPSNAPDCPGWDNTKTVTVTGPGDGPTDAKSSGGASGGSAGSSAAPSSADAGGTGASGGSTVSSAGQRPAATGSGGSGTSAAGGASTKASSAAASAAPGATGSTGSTGSSNAGAGSSSSTGASSSSSSKDTEFLLFAGGAIVLIVLGGLVVWLAHRKATSNAGGGRGYSHGRSSSSDSSSDEDRGHKRRGSRSSRRSRRSKRRYRDEEKDGSTSSSDY